MYSAFWIGVLVCAISGYRTVRLKPRHGVYIAIGAVVAVFLIHETALKRMAATGISAPQPFTPVELFSLWAFTCLWWALAFLALMWLGSRRRIKAAMEAMPDNDRLSE